MFFHACLLIVPHPMVNIALVSYFLISIWKVTIALLPLKFKIALTGCSTVMDPMQKMSFVNEITNVFIPRNRTYA